MAISLRPSTFAAGGGLVDDADLSITKARFVMTDYGGKSQNGPVPVLSVFFQDAEQAEYEQLYSIGNGFVPSEETGKEGLTLEPVGDKTAPSGSSNFSLFLNSMVNAGFPEDILDSGDISKIEGTKGHFNQVAQPKRANLPNRGGQQDDRPKTTLLMTALIHLPGEGTPATKTGTTTAKPTSTPVKQAANKAAPAATSAKTAQTVVGTASGTVDPAIVEELAGHLLNIVAESGPIKKVQIVPKLFPMVKSEPNAKALTAAAGKNEVLAALAEYGLAFDGTELKMAE